MVPTLERHGIDIAGRRLDYNTTNEEFQRHRYERRKLYDLGNFQLFETYLLYFLREVTEIKFNDVVVYEKHI